MKIQVVGSAAGESEGRHFAASYVVNDAIAIDAGTVGFMSSVDSQRRVKHVFISHTHLDHIASLPIYLDNVYEAGPECPTIYGSENVRETLMSDILNDRTWPDLVRLSLDEFPFLRLVNIEAGQAVSVEGLTVTPIALDHVVPTFGFILEDDTTAIAIVSDTSPTDAIWKAAAARPNLRAVFLESAFPNSMRWLADKAGHLTPELFAMEYAKLGRDVPVIAIHIKPAYHEEVVRELESLGLPSLRIGYPGFELEV